LRLFLSRELGAIGIDEGNDIGPCRVQLVELGQVESDREAAKAIDGKHTPPQKHKKPKTNKKYPRKKKNPYDQPKEI